MEIHDQVAAKQFVLVDDDGRPTAYLTGAQFGSVGLHVLPESGDGSVVSVGIESDTGSPRIVLTRPDGSAIVVGISETGEPYVMMKAADGTTQTITAEAGSA